MKKWLDNYNEASVSTGPGFVGEGYDTKGRNYSPAWGGQFQNGGKAYKSKPMAQSSDVKSVSNTFNADDFSNYSTIINRYPNMGNDTSYMYARNTPTGTEQFFHNTNQGKPVSQLQRGNQFINLSPEEVSAYKQKVLKGTGGFQWGGFLQPNDVRLPSGIAIPNKADILSSELAESIGGVGGEPAYLVPSFKGGKRVNSKKEFNKTGEYLGGPFKTYQEADAFDEIRHQYVEKGQSLPSPLKWWGDDMAMGGSIPGSVGFTYARTNSPAPSNGKYAKKTLASAQNGQEMKFYQEGLDWKPKNISKNGGWLDNYSEPIKDDRGQWAHPGEVTEIGSNEITMQGVDYPVLGISDTGDTQMMYPDQDYKFDGDKVTEYPMAQDGKKFSMKDVKKNATSKKYPSAEQMKGTFSKGKKDSDIENVFEIIDPTGISSWNDIVDSYKETGMSNQTALEIFGAIPMLGKVSKIGRAAEIAKDFAVTGRQKRNAEAVAKTLKAVGKYGPSTGRATDAYQAYDQKQNGGWLNKYK